LTRLSPVYAGEGRKKLNPLLNDDVPYRVSKHLSPLRFVNSRRPFSGLALKLSECVLGCGFGMEL